MLWTQVDATTAGSLKELYLMARGNEAAGSTPLPRISPAVDTSDVHAADFSDRGVPAALRDDNFGCSAHEVILRLSPYDCQANIATIAHDANCGNRNNAGMDETRPFSPAWFDAQFARTGKEQAQLYHALRERLGPSIDRTKVNKTVNGKRRVQQDEMPVVLEFFGLETRHLTNPRDTSPTEDHAPGPAQRPAPNVVIPKDPEPVDLRRFGGPRVVPAKGISLGGEKGKGDFRFNGETIDYFPRPPGIPPHRTDVYGTYVGGDSMEPKFEDGDRIYVDPKRPPAIGDYVIVELFPEGDGESGEPGEAFIKRLVRRTSTQIVVKQFNPPLEIAFDRDKVKLMHRVIPVDELLGI